MALTRLSGPSEPLFRAASIFWYDPTWLFAGMGENRSRGIDSIEAVCLGRVEVQDHHDVGQRPGVSERRAELQLLLLA